MKSLSDYMKDGQTEIFNSKGVFFAFSQAQLDESKKKGVEYVSMGAGMIAPKENAAAVMDALNALYVKSVKQDIAENGIDEIICRELINHECYYTCDIDDCVDALKGYAITREQIRSVYNKEKHKYFD